MNEKERLNNYYYQERKGKKPFRPISKKGLWEISYNDNPNLKVSGKVIAVLIRTKDGDICTIRKGLHIDVMKVFNLSPHDVAATGWRLEDGTEVWR